MTGKIACFGELLLRFSAPGRELLLQSPHLDVFVGGAEANVAIGLANLGHDVAFISLVPNNALGAAAVGHLRRYGVDTKAVTNGPGRMGFFFLAPGASVRASEVIYDREHSSFARAVTRSFNWLELLEGVDLFHLSGVTPALGPKAAAGAIAGAQAAQDAGITVSFDSNFRATLWGRWDSNPPDILAELVRRSDIFFGNHRDISLLLGREFPGAKPEQRRDAAEAAFEAFPNLKLIASTARQFDDADTQRITARVDTPDGTAQTEEVLVAGIIDRIGIGDAFAAGILHAMRIGLDLEKTARTGLALTCLKHSLPGDASLFGRREIEAFLAGEFEIRR